MQFHKFIFPASGELAAVTAWPTRRDFSSDTCSAAEFKAVGGSTLEPTACRSFPVPRIQRLRFQALILSNLPQFKHERLWIQDNTAAKILAALADAKITPADAKETLCMCHFNQHNFPVQLPRNSSNRSALCLFRA